MRHVNFRSDIQGLRAIAVLSVVLFHANKSLIPGGYVGVDIFFVISGYLISRTILGEIERGEFSIAEFYRRRVRRIFPALYSVLFFSMICGYFLLSPKDFMELSKTVVGSIFFVSNIVFLHLSGYFDGSAELKPLLHTWSLAVEEQFYILHPLILILIFRIRKELYIPVVLVLMLVSLSISVWMLHQHPGAAFYLTPPRSFELLIGAFCAAPGLSLLKGRKSNEILAISGIILIASGLILYNERVAFPGFAALVPCVGAAAIICANAKWQTFVGRVISNKVFLFFGDISYSWYLWHWPVLVFLKHIYGDELSPTEIGMAIIIGLIAAVLSRYYVERPFLGVKAARTPVLKVGVTIMVLGCIAPIVVGASQGMPNRFSTDAQRLFNASNDYNVRRVECHSDGSRIIPYSNNCTFGAKNVPPSIAIWGDSHGAELSVALGQKLVANDQSVMEITASACPPSIGYSIESRPFCVKHNNDTLVHLLEDRNIKQVVMVANFYRYRSFAYADMLDGFRRAALALDRAGKKVIVLYPIPVQSFDPPAILGVAAQDGRNLNSYGLSEKIYRAKNSAVFEMLESLERDSSVRGIYTQRYLCDSVCHVYAPDFGVLYFNEDHLSISGAKILAEAIVELK
ncbi:acyltransferase family protein [Burkholderia sp. USMB20]|uniref:acyltransferase family protein n=1 Tax=Burkholderia sp. USMB20 TaxID=1571773 RepID=UPI0005E6B770|nr:acyltransferase family protein [Burkholderia sp. USMB20]TGN94702.1 acyltransferase [Burkholderia sp. USMB20]